ncbi:MAG: hypothetical protein ACI9LA_001950, partial [Bacteroidia bacterium]
MQQRNQFLTMRCTNFFDSSLTSSRYIPLENLTVEIELNGSPQS